MAFSLCEHVLTTYVAEFVGEESEVVHLLSIAIAIALVLPFKRQVERFVEARFARLMAEV